jgi:hypothetical protein
MPVVLPIGRNLPTMPVKDAVGYHPLLQKSPHRAMNFPVTEAENSAGTDAILRRRTVIIVRLIDMVGMTDRRFAIVQRVAPTALE